MSISGLAFLLAYLAGLGLAVARHPRYGLYTYLAVFYLHPPSRWWGAFLPDLRWSLLAAIVTILVTLRMPQPKTAAPSWKQTAPATLLIVFTVWVWIQNAWALAPPEHLEASVLFTKYLVLYYLIYRLLDSVEEVGNFLFVHVLGCGYLGWLAYLAPGSGRLEGVGGPGIDEANALAMFISTGILSAGMILLGDKSWRRWVCVLIMPLLLNTLVQSESRGALLATLCSGMVLMYLRPRAYRKQFYAFAVLGAVAFGYFAQDVFWERMSTMRAAVDSEQEMDGSAESRVVLAKAQVEMALSNPHGLGHRGTVILSPQYLDERYLTRSPNDPTGTGARSSHATLMSAWVEQGIPGIVIFLLLPFWLFRMILVLRRYGKSQAPPDSRVVLYGSIAAACLMLVFVAGFFTDYIKTEVQIWMLAILATLVYVHLPAERAATQQARQRSATVDGPAPSRTPLLRPPAHR